MSVTIQRLAVSEWPMLRDLRLESLADAPYAFWATLEQEAAYGQPEWEGFASGVAWLVATRDDGAAGLVGVMPTESDLTVEPQIIGMWVRPGARRQGIARQLLDAVCDQLREQDARSVALWVTDENAGAQAFYEAYGFRPTGVREALPPGRSGTEQEARLDLASG